MGTLMKKITVANGIYWVEIPEAEITIQCGCPADSVKHLMKRGLIVDTEVGGTTFETGPNVILLSDILVQNGMFSNLAEFPVLQMLYRQGMIIPNHPNNTGLKPMIIGSEDQVEAQLEYIYRGNYGLDSHEELIAAGASAEQAEEMMRVKLKFAFGRISPTKELLDSRIIGDQAIEIRNNVWIERTGPNRFEISYKGEKVPVDLNLPSTQNYEAPYPLGFHQIRREYFGVIHSGEGDGWDVNRATMGSVLMFQGKVYLIDTGPNIQHNLTALGIGISEIEGIFHTHSHDDHFAGITTLIRAGHRIKYYATPLVRHSVTKKLAALLGLEEEIFGDYFEVHDLICGEWNDIDGLEIKPLYSPHPVETSLFIFRTLWENGYLSYAHYADIVSMNVLKGMLSKKEGDGGITTAFLEKVRRDYLTPVTIKKLDVGGGMIHGEAEDFKNDQSEKIILAHTSHELTTREKKIGSNAPFGITDVLIPDYADSIRRSGYLFLTSYFPGIPRHHLRTLLNNHVKIFSPGTIILKCNSKVDDIYLVLTGSVDLIHSREDHESLLSAGAMIGEHASLHDQPTKATFRTVSFVQALCIPSSLYREFINQNDLFTTMNQLHENREFLQRTRLFSEGISSPTHFRIAKLMTGESHNRVDAPLPTQSRNLFYLVKSGKVQRMRGDKELDTLESGDFFGEEHMIGKPLGNYRFIVKEPTEIYTMPSDELSEIPIVRWKLFESYARRKNRGMI